VRAKGWGYFISCTALTKETAEHVIKYIVLIGLCPEALLGRALKVFAFVLLCWSSQIVVCYLLFSASQPLIESPSGEHSQWRSASKQTFHSRKTPASGQTGDLNLHKTILLFGNRPCSGNERATAVVSQVVFLMWESFWTFLGRALWNVGFLVKIPPLMQQFSHLIKRFIIFALIMYTSLCLFQLLQVWGIVM
jgi:hypothetical protein